MSIVPGECVVTVMLSPRNLPDYGLPYSWGVGALVVFSFICSLPVTCPSSCELGD
jgi:hypothetical protein